MFIQLFDNSKETKMDMALAALEWIALFACLQTALDTITVLGGIILISPLMVKWWPLATKSRDAGWVYFAAGYWWVTFIWMFAQPQIIIKLF